MNHGSLFSGGGGFDLAAEAVGWRNMFHCENDAFCQTILKHYWPLADSHGNIREFHASEYKGKIDVLSGGFPCQPFSCAGKRRGTADDRYLWPEMLRVIETVSPRWVVAENVYGLINWNDGLVFGTVKSDLEAQGYEVAAFVLPAAGVNAPHQRYRVWCVGRRRNAVVRDAGTREGPKQLHTSELEEAGSDTNHDGCNSGNSKNEEYTGKTGKYAQCHTLPLGVIASDTSRKRQQGREVTYEIVPDKRKAIQQPGKPFKLGGWNNWPVESPLCSGNDGIPAELDGITFQKWRTKSVKMYGNAIVPQVAIQIFKAIQCYEKGCV